ncbi:MAG: tyrosine--tRNA ligase [Clostridiales bacterium]|jgi:tyrosyl-tRNA synthetase|nr:tyrosine--tRNA ligase [Clostridiales bacterium]
MMNGLQTLKQRGFVAQITHEAELDELFEKEQIVFYTGFDPTADSLHIGHYLQFMAMAWLQRLGHMPIVLMGGGTGMVGDPDKADEMRPLITVEEIDRRIERFKEQAAKFVDLSEGKAILANNADWLRRLNYADFIREYGIHFSVNRMLAADKYKTKFEGSGLNFFELNYVVMQAYDFLELNRRFGCALQTGGNDQWSNIIAGVELIRRVDQKAAFGLTFNLLPRADGAKMGKTMGGTIWLDENKTTPHELYQYLRNVQDEMVKQFLSMLTFLPMEEIDALTAADGEALNPAKARLAYEVTKIVHGEEAAKAAQDTMPEFTISAQDFGDGMNVLDLMVLTGLVPSKAEARRNIQQGGVIVAGEKIGEIGHIITLREFVIQKGKKTFLKISVNSQ